MLTKDIIRSSNPFDQSAEDKRARELEQRRCILHAAFRSRLTRCKVISAAK